MKPPGVTVRFKGGDTVYVRRNKPPAWLTEEKVDDYVRTFAGSPYSFYGEFRKVGFTRREAVDMDSRLAEHVPLPREDP